MNDEILRIARRRPRTLRAFAAALLLPAMVACQQESAAPSTAAQQPRAASAEDPARTRGADRTARNRQPASELDEQIARAAPEAQTAVVDSGAVGAIAPCTVCHGVNGEGNPALDAPRIGGLDAAYLARQLQHFRTSVRGETTADKYGTQMRAIAISLDDDEVIADLAAYLSGLQPPYAQESTVEGDAAHGAELYAVCTACHGPDGRGSRKLSTPSLVDQYDWYLVRQLQNYRNRLRGANPLDVYGRQMAPIVQATLTSDQDIADVVAYIKSLRAPPAKRRPRRSARSCEQTTPRGRSRASARSARSRLPRTRRGRRPS